MPQQPGPMRWRTAAAVAAGGAVGGAARYAVNAAWPSRSEAVLPWSTLIENVSGSLLLGVLMGVLIKTARPGRYIQPFLAVGVLGGYTTFSTYAVDILALVRHDEVAVAALYLFATLTLCLAATLLGLRLTRAVPLRRRRT